MRAESTCHAPLMLHLQHPNTFGECAALFFASAASDFVTGQVLYLDGGLTATQ